MGGGDVESQVRGTQESGESPWFGRGLDGVDQGSPGLAKGVRMCMLLEMIGKSWGGVKISPKVVCLWVFIEWRRPGVSH